MRLFRKLVVLLLVVFSGVGIGVYFSNPQNQADFADQVRNLIGPAPVAFAENLFYGALDRYNQWAYRDRTTPGYWDVNLTPTAPSPTPASGGLAGVLDSIVAVAQARVANPTATPTPTPSASAARLPNRAAPPIFAPAFRPTDFAPLYPNLAAPGEGHWLPLPNSADPQAPLLMYKTFLHPDPQRSYTRVAIVAIDLTRLQLHAVAGTQEPVSPVRIARSGLIPASDLSRLVAAFNGGFRAIHGHWGMMVDGQMLLPPQPSGDTVAHYRDGSLQIAPWTVISNTVSSMDWFRQTPPYLVYHGEVNPALLDEASTLWGATVDRHTVIWRSALGLSADHRILYYGAGESLTARRLAEAMVAAGASDAAELDVNLSFERFLTYDPANKNLNGALLLPAMMTKPGWYITLPAPRDFFYLTLDAPASSPP
jgi:hypothetical protein